MSRKILKTPDFLKVGYSNKIYLVMSYIFEGGKTNPNESQDANGSADNHGYINLTLCCRAHQQKPRRQGSEGSCNSSTGGRGWGSLLSSWGTVSSAGSTVYSQLHNRGTPRHSTELKCLLSESHGIHWETLQRDLQCLLIRANKGS